MKLTVVMKSFNLVILVVGGGMALMATVISFLELVHVLK